jgi:hypothetical protein
MTHEQTLGEVIDSGKDLVRESFTGPSNRWQDLSTNMGMILVVTGIAIAAAVGVGVWWVIVGATTGSTGGLFRDGVDFAYQWRPFGAVLIALALLIGPPALAVELAIRAYADDRA